MKKNILFLRIFSIIYLLTCLTTTFILYYIIVGNFIYLADQKNNVNVLEQFETSLWPIIPTFIIINGIFSPIISSSINLHFKYTNNRTYLKYTWFCLSTILFEEFFLIKLIFIIIFIFKIWSKKCIKQHDDENTKWNHVYTRSICIFLFIIGVITYFGILLCFNKIDVIGPSFACVIIYGLIPKLVANSFIDLKLSKMDISNNLMTKILFSTFFGIFPYTKHLLNNLNIKKIIFSK